MRQEGLVHAGAALNEVNRRRQGRVRLALVGLDELIQERTGFFQMPRGLGDGGSGLRIFADRLLGQGPASPAGQGGLGGQVHVQRRWREHDGLLAQACRVHELLDNQNDVVRVFALLESL